MKQATKLKKLVLTIGLGVGIGVSAMANAASGSQCRAWLDLCEGFGPNSHTYCWMYQNNCGLIP